MASMVASLFAVFIMFLSMGLGGINALSSNYYDRTCPKAEEAIAGVVKAAMGKDKTVAAAILRMHFHDCFIRVPSINLALFRVHLPLSKKLEPVEIVYICSFC